jgi:hypothetical protein
MRKHLLILSLTATCSLAAHAQTGVQRDPNPPYGAAAATAATANGNAGQTAGSVPPGASAPSSNQASAPDTATTTSANARTNSAATAGTAGANARSAGPQASSGSSTAPGAAQGAPAERPGAAIASRGSTTAGGSKAGPYDPGSTPGWSMMTPQEQQSYSGRMSSFTSVAQCRAYQAAYLAQIQERARRMGQIVQPQESDPCATLQQQGALK